VFVDPLEEFDRWCGRSCFSPFIAWESDLANAKFSSEFSLRPAQWTVEITHGYSRDHRPDLVQIVQEMLVSDTYGIPLGIKQRWISIYSKTPTEYYLRFLDSQNNV